jgi:two-component system cell cycle response regulator CpdR
MTQKILLAEDDNDMRRFLVKALEKAGYKVLSYDNGASAYDRLREEPFSLLLTDIVMPEMDGIELARRATEGSEGCEGAFQAFPPSRSRRRGQ